MASTIQCFSISCRQVYDVEDHPGGDEVLLSAVGRTQAKISRLSEFYVGDVNLSTIPTKINYRPPKQPHYNQDKTPQFIVKLLRFLVPLSIM